MSADRVLAVWSEPEMMCNVYICVCDVCGCLMCICVCVMCDVCECLVCVCV